MSLHNLIRGQLSQMNAPSPVNHENPVEYFQKCWNATEAGEWGDAARYMKRCVELEKNALVMDEPLHELGSFDIAVKLHAEVSCNLKVMVVRDDAE